MSDSTSTGAQSAAGTVASAQSAIGTATGMQPVSSRAAHPQPARDLAIETRGLVKTFGKQAAVDGLDLAVPRGTVFGLIGPNGAGKTTTLRMLAGLAEPTEGAIRLCGQPVEGLRHESAVHRLVGYMPDFFGVYEDMRSWEYLDFFARCYGIPPDRRAQLVDDLLDLVDLAGKRDADVNTLSRGMKQRLCLAHALAHDPEVLLLDEPASGLDPRARLEMRELLIELRTLGKTIVVSSHILPELEDMCDAIGIMERGRLLANGPVHDIERMLGAGQDVRLRVITPIAAAAAVLAGLPGVSIDLDEDPAAAKGGGGWLTFRLEGGEDAHAEVTARLAAAGVRFSAYQPRERDLEDLFMRITKGEVA